MRLPDWLARRAQSDGERLAVVAGEVRWTFRELDRRATRAARRLAALGVKPGDRVALLLPNGPEWAELVHGAGRIGAVLVPLNVRLAPAEVAWQLEQAGARLLLYAPGTEATAQAALAALAPGRGASLRALDVRELEEVREAADAPLRADVELEAAHSLLFTSGTTGRPKAVVLTYGNFWWSAVASALHLGIGRDDRWLVNLPLFHVGGLSILLRSAICGTTAVVHPRFDPEAANRAVDQEGVTLLSLVATTLARMLDARGRRPFPHWLRAALVGGGPTPAALLERAADLGMPVAPTYGLTEAASQVATLPPQERRRKPGSSGRPLMVTEVRIVADGHPARPGEAGEIWVRGPTVSPGYLQAPGEPGGRAVPGLPDRGVVPLTDAGGWLHTGDLGYLDEEGYLYVLDRRDDLIISGGENVYPAEVEAALLAHPAVEEAAVVGRPDPEWGQVPVAVVRLRPGAAVPAEALAAHCASLLARYKVPREIRIVQAPLPRNAAGKLLRARIRDGWAGGR